MHRPRGAWASWLARTAIVLAGALACWWLTGVALTRIYDEGRAQTDDQYFALMRGPAILIEAELRRTPPAQWPELLARLRQQFDYNWHRDYNPALGRYVQSDPIGLGGGTNTYAYSGSSPVSVVDATGFLASLPGPSATEVAAQAMKIALKRAGITIAIGGGPEDPVGDVAGLVIGVGSLGYEIWAHTGDRASYPPTPITDPQADIDHDAYKEELSRPLPPTNDTCHYLELKLERQKKLLGARQKWDATYWNEAIMGPSPHAGSNAETRNAIAALESKIYQCKKQKCR